VKRITLIVCISLTFTGIFAQAPVNDDCSNALNFNPSGGGDTLCMGASGDVRFASESLAPCAGTIANARDIWYKFVAPSPSIFLKLNAMGNIAIQNPIIELFSGTCGSLTSIVCIFDPVVNGFVERRINSLVPGTIYYIRVYSDTPDDLHYSFGLSICKVLANDECDGAEPLTIGTGACTNQILTTTNGTTQSLPPCGGTMANDRWYKFDATDTLVALKLTNGGISNPVIEVFSGSCGSLTSIQCINKPYLPVDGGLIRDLIKNLIVGQTYYLRIYSGNSNGGAFWLCLYDAEENDECGGAFEMVVNPGVSWTYTPGNNRYRTISINNSCTNNKFADGWFKFVAEDTAHLFSIKDTASRNFATSTFVNIYSGSCGSLTLLPNIKNASNPLSSYCFSSSFGDYVRLSSLTIGSTYYVSIIDNFTNENGADSFRIAVSHLALNDDIGSAIDVPVSANTNCSPFQGNMRNASWGPGATVPNCGGNTSGTDVWYKFTATSTRHIVSVTRPDNGSNTPEFEVHYFNGGVQTSLGCQARPMREFSGLTPGTVYYIRVKNNTYYKDDFFFTICVTTPDAVPPNNECSSPLPLTETQPILGSDLGVTFTGSQIACGGSPSNSPDLWYSFTPPYNANVEIRLIPEVTSTGNIQVFSGSCGTLTPVACPTLPSNFRTAGFQALTTQTYFIRVIPNSNNFLLFVTNVFGLPVKLTSFEARVIDDKSVKIIWKTAEESQIKHYEIERSRDGINFETITKVNSRNSPAPAEYSGDDLSPEPGINYYRLKIVNEDGKIEYSRIERINFKGRFTDNLQVIRQGNTLLIKNQSNITKNAGIVVYTATGQQIYSSRKLLAPGSNNFNLPGKINQVLFVKIEMGGGETKTFKVMY